MNPSDAAWWWQEAFGAIATGLVTAMAVILTLRSERRHTRFDLVIHDLREIRGLAARLPTDPVGSEERDTWAMLRTNEVVPKLIAVVPLLAGTWPTLMLNLLSASTCLATPESARGSHDTLAGETLTDKSDAEIRELALAEIRQTLDRWFMGSQGPEGPGPVSRRVGRVRERIAMAHLRRHRRKQLGR